MLGHHLRIVHGGGNGQHDIHGDAVRGLPQDAVAWGCRMMNLPVAVALILFDAWIWLHNAILILRGAS